ncbi:MAG: hypothetical protein R3200_05510 [Xanthomonadales bacterium]|nr:hypothetical protein [Xanthomonadales bacterium]
MLSKPFRRVIPCAVLVVLTALLGAEVALGQEFCWKDSYGRGVGTVPDSCPRGQERIGLLCYDRCPSGMKRVGVDCHSVCPAGMEDQGLYCRRTEYGRGAGYPWKFGDGLNDKGMRRRCEADHGKGKCEKSGEIYYPKCKAGYKPFGCCICRPERPNCSALGLGRQIDLSCEKRIQIGNPQTGSCGSGEEKDAGLCYARCESGYDGIGPVCWADKPRGWVNCGMGAAKDSATCGTIVFNQVSSVGQMAMFVGSLGTSSAASAGSNSARLAQLKRKFEDMKRSWNQIKDRPEVRAAIESAKTAGTVKRVYDITQEVNSATTEEDMARVAAQIAAILDPTGVSATVAAYTYPVCSKYFADQGRPGATPPPPTSTPGVAGPGQPPPTGTAQPAPISIPDRPLTQDGANGRNVVRADHARGRFEQAADGRWAELDGNGRVAFTFRETGRDDWSVYLNDPSRNVQIQIDLYRKMISFGSNNAPKQDLYRIDRAWRVGSSAPPPPQNTAPPPQSAPTTVPDRPLTQDGVNGRNVVRADHSNGRFEQTANGAWAEFDANGRAGFTFRETGRDDWSVYLNDRSRNVQIQIDIHRKMIRYGTNNGPKQDLYPITRSWRVGTGQGSSTGALSQSGVNGRNVVRADHASGRFEMTGNGVWKELDANGRAGFTFQETGRDDWSVYLNDRSRNVQIQIDIHRKMIRYGTNNGPKQDLYRITSAWRR